MWISLEVTHSITFRRPTAVESSSDWYLFVSDCLFRLLVIEALLLQTFGACVIGRKIGCTLAGRPTRHDENEEAVKSFWSLLNGVCVNREGHPH